MRGRVLLMSLLLVSGCSSTRTPTLVLPDLPPEFPNHSQDKILTFVAASADEVHSLESKTRIRFDTPDGSGSANLTIRHRDSDSLLASVRVTLGIEAAKALITSDSFYVYQRIGKKLYYGEAEMIKAFFPTPAPLRELFPALTGTIVPDPTGQWQISADSLYYHLVDDDRGLAYSVDPRIWRVVKMELRSHAGEVVEVRTFSDFDWFGSAILPRRIEAVRPRDRQRVSAYHRSVEVNPPELSLDFEIGEVSERILVRSASP